jgi:hypothetical protein
MFSFFRDLLDALYVRADTLVAAEAVRLTANTQHSAAEAIQLMADTPLVAAEAGLLDQRVFITVKAT